jgi:ABC-2 type transport system permease protein
MSTHVAIDPDELGLGKAPEAGYGRRITGPTALGSDPKRLWSLTWTLAKTEFKLAYFGSVLGYIWQLMRPLMLFGVIFAVIDVIDKKLTNGVPFFPVSVLLGIVMFSFFSEGTAGSVTSLVSRETLIRKVEFPRLVVPLSFVLTGLMNFALNLIPVLVFLLAMGGSPSWTWFEMPLLIFLSTAFAIGLGMILSVGYVRFRDVKPIWEVVLQMLFYASPIFYPITAVEKPLDILGVRVDVAHVMMANPFVAILVQSRHSFIDSRYPSAATAIGGTGMLLIPIGIGLGVLALGFVLFTREAPKVAELL